MRDLPVALQLFSVRTDMESDFEGTLKRIKAFGYDGVEFAGLFDRSAHDIKKMCGEIGLMPISAHVPYNELLNEESVFKTYADIGCKYIVIPRANDDCLAGGERNAEFYKNLIKLGNLANRYGMKLCYHNHNSEFKRFNGVYKLDLMYEAISPKLLSTQLDTCWVKISGENPAEYMRKYAGRIEIVHFKDFIGSGDRFDYRPIGLGRQDFPSMLRAARELNVKWIVVEQDEPSMGKSPMECARLSMNYLKSVI